MNLHSLKLNEVQTEPARLEGMLLLSLPFLTGSGFTSASSQAGLEGASSSVTYLPDWQKVRDWGLCSANYTWGLGLSRGT